MLVFKRRSLTETEKKAKGNRCVLTLGACGVFGFWKNLVISAFSALMRCNLRDDKEMKRNGGFSNTHRPLELNPKHFKVESIILTLTLKTYRPSGGHQAISGCQSCSGRQKGCARPA